MLPLHSMDDKRQRESPAILTRSGLSLSSLARMQGLKASQSLERSGLYLTGLTRARSFSERIALQKENGKGN
jgi:hypothetical protein